MGAPKLKSRVPAAEYLALEQKAVERHEYLDGQVFAMAGESGEHADISANLVALLVTQLRGTPCRARTKDTKVRSGPSIASAESYQGLFSYPDVVVICGEPEYYDDHQQVITNPTAIVEVLSPGTEAFDRGEKFNRYQLWNPTLADYVLVSQDKAQIEWFTRQADGKWLYSIHRGLEASVEIASIGCSLSLSEVYERVVDGAREGDLG